MKKLISTKLVSLVAGLALLAGCVTEEAPPPAAPENPPPPMSEVIPPQTNATFVWTPGYWDWRGRWVWSHGYWGPSPHPGARWVQGTWMRRRGRNVWVHPHWQ